TNCNRCCVSSARYSQWRSVARACGAAKSKSMRTTQKIIIALWWTALGCLPAQAGDVQGLITDASGKPVANAVIALYGRDAAAGVSVAATATVTAIATAPA